MTVQRARYRVVNAGDVGIGVRALKQRLIDLDFGYEALDVAEDRQLAEIGTRKADQKGIGRTAGQRAD